DLTVCLFDCLTQGALGMGYPGLDVFLEDVGLIRWSTTITSNVLAERSGPRVGVLISQGHERDLYGADQKSLLLDRLVLERDVIGLNGSPRRDHITRAGRSLVESGGQRECLRLESAHLDAT